MNKQTNNILRGVFIFGFGLFVVLYFAGSVKPPKTDQIEQKRALNTEGFDVKSYIDRSKKEINADALNKIVEFEKKSAFKSLAGTWYELGFPIISGFYADAIAEVANSEESWSIAGTTYSLALQKEAKDELKLFARDKAISAYEKAISLNPDSPDHRLNLALCYVDLPLQDQPMKGILMLVGLQKDYPKNTGILLNLGRLSIKTGQWEKAKERFSTVLDLDPENKKANCGLVQVYEALGDVEKMAIHRNKCENSD